MSPGQDRMQTSFSYNKKYRNLQTNQGFFSGLARRVVQVVEIIDYRILML
jgi:hypothetical protein